MLWKEIMWEQKWDSIRPCCSGQVKNVTLSYPKTCSHVVFWVKNFPKGKVYHILLKECILFCHFCPVNARDYIKRCQVCFNCFLLLFILTIPMQNMICDINIFCTLLKTVIMTFLMFLHCAISYEMCLVDTVKIIRLNKVPEKILLIYSVEL